ncbi:MAG: AI-2E family transporter [Oscillospiraceae bacterium]|nr:AI-2E family transporter [Oscillospiraceae bacterium]
MQLDRENMKKIIIIGCAVVLFWAVLTHLGVVWSTIMWLVDVFMPVIIGVAVAFLMAPLAQIFEELFLRKPKNKKAPLISKPAARTLSVLVATLLVLAFIALFILIIFPELQDAFTSLRDSLPTTIANGILWLDNTAASFGVELEFSNFDGIDWSKVITQLGEILFPAEGDGKGLIGSVVGIASSVVSALVNLGLGFIIGIYIVISRESVERFFSRFVKAFAGAEFAEKLFDFFDLCMTSFRDFITGQLLEAIAMSAMCSVGLTIFRFPYAIAAGFTMGLTALIPVFGAWIGGIVGFLLALTESPVKALLFIVFIVCLQAFDNTFIYPRIVGNSMKLHGLLVFVAVTVGGSLAGVAGMVLGVPAVSVIYTLLNRGIEKRLKAKHIKE